uniref:CCHC-type domain-containing protein n=1 Tax=Chenopodium quinoa TaxID=63459 RepID=A0A803MV91_CHEQI
MWVRLLDVSFNKRYVSVMYDVGEFLGGFMEMDDSDPLGWGENMRIKVLIDINKPLRRGLFLAMGNNQSRCIDIKYERLADFCFFCGRLDHTERECQQKEQAKDDEKKMVYQYGPWLRASPKKFRFDAGEKEFEKAWVESLRTSIITRKIPTYNDPNVIKLGQVGAARKLCFASPIKQGSEKGVGVKQSREAGIGRKGSGGLALLWKDSFDVEIKSFSMNHIDAWVRWPNIGRWKFTGIYGSSKEENKFKTGLLLDNLHNNHSGPWICGGDFNLMLTSNEKKGGREFNIVEAEILRNVVAVCEFEDIGYMGHDYTWTDNTGGEGNVQGRLDRFFANKEWCALFSRSFVSHLSKRKSDHLPLLFCISEGVGKPKKKKLNTKKHYKFEEMWLRDEMCGDIVANVWHYGGVICSKIAHTSINLSAWSHNKFGDFVKELKDCRACMECLMKEDQTDDTIAQMRALDDRMDK